MTHFYFLVFAISSINCWKVGHKQLIFSEIGDGKWLDFIDSIAIIDSAHWSKRDEMREYIYWICFQAGFFSQKKKTAELTVCR